MQIWSWLGGRSAHYQEVSWKCQARRYGTGAEFFHGGRIKTNPNKQHYVRTAHQEGSAIFYWLHKNHGNKHCFDEDKSKKTLSQTWLVLNTGVHLCQFSFSFKFEMFGLMFWHSLKFCVWITSLAKQVQSPKILYLEDRYSSHTKMCYWPSFELKFRHYPYCLCSHVFCIMKRVMSDESAPIAFRCITLHKWLWRYWI